MKILVMCLGNVNRSPLAEAVLMGEGFDVISMGFRESGKRAAKKTRDWALKNGYNLDAHRSQHIRRKSVVWADVILCMNPKHEVDLVNLYPEAEKKIKLLGEYDGGHLSIPDPGFIHPNKPEFDAALRRVVNCCKAFAKEHKK